MPSIVFKQTNFYLKLWKISQNLITKIVSLPTALAAVTNKNELTFLINSEES